MIGISESPSAEAYDTIGPVASIQDLARELHKILNIVGRSAAWIERATRDLRESRTTWQRAVTGSTAVESSQVQAGLTAAIDQLDEVRRTLSSTASAVGRCLDRVVGSDSPEVEPNRDAIRPGSSPTLGDRISASQARVGVRPTRTPTSGEWVRSDGEALRINSGDSDGWHPRVVAFIRTELPDRYKRALAVATHCEAKVAIAMRDGWRTTEHVVIDKLLPTLSPPGARLTVVQGDGTTRTCLGEDDPT